MKGTGKTSRNRIPVEIRQSCIFSINLLNIEFSQGSPVKEVIDRVYHIIKLRATVSSPERLKANTVFTREHAAH